jgi:[ribosomal protein S5]-alanine N-acetyltransferase
VRPLARTDRPGFLAAMNESRRLHASWLIPPRTVAEFDRLLARAQGETCQSLLARRIEDEAIVGFFNLSEIVRGPFQNAYLGYGASARHAGRGYMSEALKLVLATAFGELGLHRIEANIQPANTASLALVRRNGFVREGLSERYLKVSGRWRDHERWAIRAEQWRERRIRTR